MRGNIRRPSGDKAMPRATMSGGDIPSMRASPKTISPLLGGFNPMMARSVLVLPAPLLPTSETIWVGAISTLTPLTATLLPYSTWMSRT